MVLEGSICWVIESIDVIFCSAIQVPIMSHQVACGLGCWGNSSASDDVPDSSAERNSTSCPGANAEMRAALSVHGCFSFCLVSYGCRTRIWYSL